MLRLHSKSIMKINAAFLLFLVLRWELHCSLVYERYNKGTYLELQLFVLHSTTQHFSGFVVTLNIATIQNIYSYQDNSTVHSKISEIERLSMWGRSQVTTAPIPRTASTPARWLNSTLASVRLTGSARSEQTNFRYNYDSSYFPGDIFCFLPRLELVGCRRVGLRGENSDDQYPKVSPRAGTWRSSPRRETSQYLR